MLCRLVPRGSAVNYLLAAGPVPPLLTFLERTYLLSGLVHWDEPEEWDGEGGRKGGSRRGTHVHPWLIHVNVWQKLL